MTAPIQLYGPYRRSRARTLARKAGQETAAQRIEAAQEKFLALSSGQSDSREPEEIGAALPSVFRRGIFSTNMAMTIRSSSWVTQR